VSIIIVAAVVRLLLAAFVVIVIVAASSERDDERKDDPALQKLMRHKSYLTTQRYINMADQLTTAVSVLHVPEKLRKAQA